MEVLRTIGPVVLALAAVLLFDHMTRRRGLDPPGFRVPLRRIAGTSLVAFSFYAGIFAALGSIGRQGEVDLSRLESWQLFALHGLFALTIVGWWVSGFFATGKAPGALLSPEGFGDAPAPAWRSFAEQLGFATPNLSRELAVGAVAGFAAWLAVLCGVVLFAVALAAISGEELLPQAPPAVIPWLAARPVLLRLGIAASAGLVEETFFRGFLQPRIGIALTTLFFALAHLSYDQPIMLVGVTLLSLLYGLLTRWRQNIWPAIVAHFLFDAIQLLVVIPAVLQLFQPGAK
ncbi:MAG: CPBP family intramembrane glutamic endopeptidase [Thermoanaerobaculia bacterium]